MPTVTDSDLKELKDLINNRFDKLEVRIQAMEIGQAKIESRLEEWKNSVQKIPDLAEKVGELKNWKQIGLTLSGTFIGAAITYLARH
jgi:hypothetical protein